MLKISNYTNTERLKVSLAFPDLNIVLYERLLKLKEKYCLIFNEECTLYDRYIVEIERKNTMIDGAKALIDSNLMAKAEKLETNNYVNDFKEKLNKRIFK